MSRKVIVPSARKPVRTADLGRVTPRRLERLLQREDKPDRPVRAQRQECHQRLVLGVLLAAEAAARIGRQDLHLGQRQFQQLSDGPLQPVRVLDRAPDGDAVAVGGGDEAVRLDREVGHHRERVAARDDEVAAGRVDVAPAVPVLVQDVRVRPAGRRAARPGPAPAARRVRARRRPCIRPEAPRSRPGPGGRPPRAASERVGGDRRHGLAVVLRLADGQDRPVAVLRAEPRAPAGGGQRRSSPPRRRARPGGAGVDRADPRPRAVERDELGVQHVWQADVAEVAVGAGDAAGPPDALRRRYRPRRSSLAPPRAGRPGTASVIWP